MVFTSNFLSAAFSKLCYNHQAVTWLGYQSLIIRSDVTVDDVFQIFLAT